jgi:predicted DNA-binding transcriptional regulator YafY
MRRAERLFQIIQILRRHRRAVTADAIAAELEVSVRTVYRDVAELIGQRVPIDGAAGVGYLLREGFDLPPLMFTEDELEALVIGVRIVDSWADPALGRAARDVLAKIAAVVPERLRPRVASLALAAPPSGRRPEIGVDMASLRR